MNATETASTVAAYLNVWRNRSTDPGVDELIDLLYLRVAAFRAVAHWASERCRWGLEAAAWAVVSDSLETLAVLEAVA